MFNDPFIDSFNDPFFNIISFLFPIIFILILGIFLFVIIRSLKEWNYNNKQPIIPVNATIVCKRTSVSDFHNGNENQISSTSTSYYVTFEYINGERQEFHVTGSDYGLLAEGDKGTLSFQGTRFIDFKREF